MDEDAIPERPVTFAPHTAPFTLASWTDSTLANYSGSALYETTFRMDAIQAGESLILDLGKVGLAAEVWLNGQKAGERAWRPYELDITSHIRRGVNRLKIRIANSNAGRMAQGPPVYGRDTWSGLKFESERDRLRTLRPNGLEGPVRILGFKAEKEK
jgi:beta-galactosidase/beta-glucuronidase